MGWFATQILELERRIVALEAQEFALRSDPEKAAEPAVLEQLAAVAAEIAATSMSIMLARGDQQARAA